MRGRHDQGWADQRRRRHQLEDIGIILLCALIIASVAWAWLDAEDRQELPPRAAPAVLAPSRKRKHGSRWWRRHRGPSRRELEQRLVRVMFERDDLRRERDEAQQLAALRLRQRERDVTRAEGKALDMQARAEAAEAVQRELGQEVDRLREQERELIDIARSEVGDDLPTKLRERVRAEKAAEAARTEAQGPPATVKGKPPTGDMVSAECWECNHSRCSGTGIYDGVPGRCQCDCHHDGGAPLGTSPQGYDPPPTGLRLLDACAALVQRLARVSRCVQVMGPPAPLAEWMAIHMDARQLYPDARTQEERIIEARGMVP